MGKPLGIAGTGLHIIKRKGVRTRALRGKTGYLYKDRLTRKGKGRRVWHASPSTRAAIIDVERMAGIERYIMRYPELERIGAPCHAVAISCSRPQPVFGIFHTRHVYRR